MGKNSKKQGDQNQCDDIDNGGVIVLGVYLHCQGCVNSVIKYLRGFDGVEQIEPNITNHTVVVKGKGADPIKVKERLQKKLGKHVHVHLISPIHVQQNKQVMKKPEVIEVLLKVYLHCGGCAKDVKVGIHKMTGVQTVEPDMGSNLVKVKGTFESDKLVDLVNKQLGKNAHVVKVTDVKNEDNKQGEVSYPNYPSNLLYVFSDENPNACSVM